MSEEDTVFSNRIKYEGIFSFSNFYKFCRDYLAEELGFDISENVYSEKLVGDKKDIKIEWRGERKLNDFFKYKIKIYFEIIGLSNVEIEQDGKRKKTNKGIIEFKVKGVLVHDYKGQYETKPMMRFLRGVYEKWVIPSRVERIEEDLISACDDFLGQAKAYLDLEGKK